MGTNLHLPANQNRNTIAENPKIDKSSPIRILNIGRNIPIMLNQLSPDITAKTTIWMAVVPEECERQAERTPEVSLAFELGQTELLKNGVRLHFISVPGTHKVALGVPVREFKATEFTLLDINSLVTECAVAKATLIPILRALGFERAESIAQLFLTTELRKVPPWLR